MSDTKDDNDDNDDYGGEEGEEGEREESNHSADEQTPPLKEHRIQVSPSPASDAMQQQHQQHRQSGEDTCCSRWMSRFKRHPEAAAKTATLLPSATNGTVSGTLRIALTKWRNDTPIEIFAMETLGLLFLYYGIQELFDARLAPGWQRYTLGLVIGLFSVTLVVLYRIEVIGRPMKAEASLTLPPSQPMKETPKSKPSTKKKPTSRPKSTSTSSSSSSSASKNNNNNPSTAPDEVVRPGSASGTRSRKRENSRPPKKKDQRTPGLVEES